MVLDAVMAAINSVCRTLVRPSLMLASRCAFPAVAVVRRNSGECCRFSFSQLPQFRNERQQRQRTDHANGVDAAYQLIVRIKPVILFYRFKQVAFNLMDLLFEPHPMSLRCFLMRPGSNALCTGIAIYLRMYLIIRSGWLRQCSR